METRRSKRRKLRAQEQDQSTTTNIHLSLPIEIIENILSRLAIKSILQFRSVSKPWLSHISNPSFTKLHFTRSIATHRTGLFISAYDQSTRKRYLLSAPHDTGPVTHLMTLNDSRTIGITQTEHLNGLVCFTYVSWCSDDNYARAFVINPSTRKIHSLPDPDSLTTYSSKNAHVCYVFGFDESSNEHKVLYLKRRNHARSLEDSNTGKVEIMIYSLSSRSWRKIDDVEPPVGFSWDRLNYEMSKSVCVNSVVHLMVQGSFDILAFDLRTEKFSIISTPEDVVPRTLSSLYARNRKTSVKINKPFLIKINGCVGVVCHDRVLESNQVHIWILQEYENRVWVKETIVFPDAWSELDDPFPLDGDDMGNIIFPGRKVSRNVMIDVPVYSKKSRSFEPLRLTLGDRFLCSKNVHFGEIKYYVESIRPL